MVSGYFQTCECAYCKKVGSWPHKVYLKTIDRNWFETPKNATVSIKWGIGFQHKKPRELSTPTLVVYREPVDRFRSCFIHYFHETGLRFQNNEKKRFGDGVGFFENLGYNIRELSLHERADILLENLDKLSTREEVHHWWPQVNFFKPDNIEIVSIKKILEVFKVEQKLNVAPKKVDFQFTNEQKDVIMNVYKDDYDFFEGKI